MNDYSIPLADDFLTNWQTTLANLKHNYATTADNLSDEILVMVSQDQLNDALNEFVVKNVGLLLGLKLELQDGYLRLYCTANFLGMHFSVASNFRLIQIRADKITQIVVFEQISDTEVLELHTKAWWQKPLIKSALNLYRTILKKDPLPFLLSLSPKLSGKPFIEYKGNFIYLEIGRWLNAKIQPVKLLPKERIKDYFKKVQINTAYVKKERLLLKIQPNFSEIFSLGDPNADIITKDDNPNKSSE